ncbi:MAG TPA: NADP-dependent oxidoreductase [Candidatus Nitrosocosmicus sp.]|nr:NADP-dependent oxidoreductase [Candidatus Nitrosocosmicus sp.]
MKNERFGHEVHLKKRPIGSVKVEDFELVKVEIPDLKEEGDFLVRNIWMSIDPFLRIYMVKGTKFAPPFELHKPLDGGCIGEVIESKSSKFKVGDYVKANFGWREYWIGKATQGEKNSISKVDSTLSPLRSFLGLLGITGMTAYVGLFKICNLRERQDTVFVSSAAGGVGSAACQLAKIKGCYVVGSCGSDEKASWLVNELGIDYAFNYRKIGLDNITEELNRAYPNGIDLYFDNVGGKHLEAAINNMNTFGRIALCGTTSQYNDEDTVISAKGDQQSNKSPSLGPSNLSLAVSHRLKLQGFIWSDHFDILNEFNANMSKWISEDKIKLKESIFEGLENAPQAFVSLFRGDAMGRILVRLY